MTEYNADRVLKLIRSDKVLRKVYEKRHPKGNRNEAALKTIFNALIKTDKKWMEQYSLTK